MFYSSAIGIDRVWLRERPEETPDSQFRASASHRVGLCARACATLSFHMLKRRTLP